MRQHNDHISLYNTSTSTPLSPPLSSRRCGFEDGPSSAPARAAVRPRVQWTTVLYWCRGMPGSRGRGCILSVTTGRCGGRCGRYEDREIRVGKRERKRPGRESQGEPGRERENRGRENRLLYSVVDRGLGVGYVPAMRQCGKTATCILSTDQ